MSVCQDMAQQVALDLKTSQGVPDAVAFDPATLMVIIGIIQGIIQLWQSCKKTPAQAVQEAAAPGVISRIRVRWLIRRKLNKPGQRDLQAKVHASLLSVGRGTAVPTMTQAYQEVQGVVK